MRTRRFRWIFYPSALLTLALAIALRWIDSFITTSMAPQGIVSFELARTSEAARLIVESWGMDNRYWALVSLWLDFPFLFGYVTVFLCLTLLTRPPLRNLFAVGFVLAGACDFLENLVLLRIVHGHYQTFYVQLAYASASTKFGLLLAGWAYLLVYGCWYLWQRRRQAL